jgi:hypothetical protein
VNWDAAYEAAQAGLNDYEQRLDANGSYSVCSKTYTTGCPTNPALAGWVPASSTPPEYYSYSPNVQSSQGLVTLEVSGKAGSGADQIVRTFDYTVKPATSLDDVYWTNYETLDPTISGLPNGCSQNYGPSYYATSAPGNANNPPSACTVEFDSQDTLNGPIFSNDAFRVCGATFNGTVESGDSGDSAGWTSGASAPCAAGVYNDGNPKVVSSTPPQTSIPSTDLTAAQKYGCEFTGNVTLSLSLYPTTSPTTTKISWSGGTLAPSSQSFCTSPITLSGMTAGLIYANGTVTISGNMKGLLDVMAGQNIIVSGNLEYGTSGVTTTDTTDALGLISTNWIQMGTTSSPVSNLTVDAAILALGDSFYLPNWASDSRLGTLTVFGSIAQDFRGPVGTVNVSCSGYPQTCTTTVATGYAKDYIYDYSLQTLWPPYFVPPTGATWSPTTFEECLAGLNQSVLNTPNC